MKYERKTYIQISHFNDGNTYKKYEQAVKDRNFEALHEVLTDCHGHNMFVEVSVDAPIDNKKTFVIDDDRLTQSIMEWNNTNVTLHKDFEGCGGRISLELMCHVLAMKVAAIMAGQYKEITVTIHETRDIKASITIN